MSRVVIKEVGNRYSRLLVIEMAGRDKHNNILWKCLCDCGKETVVRGVLLRRGNTKSCGCLRRDNALSRVGKMSENNKLHPGQAHFNEIYLQYKRNAKARNLLFELTKEDFSFLTKMNCLYCGRAPTQERDVSKYNGGYTHNGIDRIDNSKGYTLDNVVPCCKLCNQWKRTMAATEFIEHARRIVNHRNKTEDRK